MTKIIFTFLVRIFSAIDVADSSNNRLSIGAMDGPCSPCTLTKIKRTHRQKNRCNKFNATKKIDGFFGCKSFISLVLAIWPICCLLVIVILWKNCAALRVNLLKSRLNKSFTEITDIRTKFCNFSSAFFARGTDDRRKRNNPKFNRNIDDNTDFLVFDCTLTGGNLLIVRCKIASFSTIFLFCFYLYNVCVLPINLFLLMC